MNLQQLDHFLAVVETQSFSRAADKLHLTQPALSRSIQALEEELGGPLLERGKNKTLTALGELALARARRVRVELAELRRSAKILANVEAGTLRLGLGPAPTAMLSVHLLQHMMQRYPRHQGSVKRWHRRHATAGTARRRRRCADPAP